MSLRTPPTDTLNFPGDWAFAPVMEPAFLNGVGPRVDFNGLGAIANFPYSAPYEDLTIKAK